MIVLWIALGGAVGAAARWGIGGWIHQWSGTALPWGTFAVNVAGAFGLGFGVRYLEGVAASPELRALVAVGFLGAFTTFSTFSYEAVLLLEEGAWGRAALYLGASVALGLVGVLLGLGLASVALQRGA